jgi:hypothetical protein
MIGHITVLKLNIGSWGLTNLKNFQRNDKIFIHSKKCLFLKNKDGFLKPTNPFRFFFARNQVMQGSLEKIGTTFSFPVPGKSNHFPDSPQK